MIFQLKDYQQRAVHDLIAASRNLLETSDSARIIFQSPTGSGKTIMLAEALKGMLQEYLPKQYVFIWVSFYKIHLQSYQKLKEYLQDTRYRLLQLEDLQNQPLDENSLLFVNWHSLTKKDRKTGQYSNKYMREREDGRTLKNILARTRNDDKGVILIVDEAHQHYTSEQSTEFINDIVQPVLRVEVSATPKTVAGELFDQKIIKVELEDVIASGLIKESCILNPSIGEYHVDKSAINETVIKAALAKRKQLISAYSETNEDINPLILVQLPSDTERMSTMDANVLEDTEQKLRNQGIDYENGKLALWLADKKENLDDIVDLNSPVDVLIFKQAIATGWDCPRAQILVMLREIGSLTFKIQVIGRIMRMPRACHYLEKPELNKAYVFSNLNAIEFDKDIASYMPYQEANLKERVEGIELPKEYAPRQDYGDLTAIFSQILVDTLNEYFDIQGDDILNRIRDKITGKLDLDLDKLKVPLLTDTVISNIDMNDDEMQRLDKKYIDLSVADKDIQGLFDHLLKIWCQPYAPSRSISKIKTGLYRWFNKFGFDYGDTQRILTCSGGNQDIFSQAIERAKQKYAQKHGEDIQRCNMVQEGHFNLPSRDSFGGNYRQETVNNYAYDKCYLKTNRSNPEKKFEEILKNSELVVWWYKNGEGQQQYFSIVYKTKDEKLKLEKYNNFYPDYICYFKDGSIGIYEIKSGDIDQNKEAKRIALANYLSDNRNLNLKGGLFDLANSNELNLLLKDFA